LALHRDIMILHRVPKLATPFASDTPNSVCVLWNLTKKTNIVHCTNLTLLTFTHNYHDIPTLPCVLSQEDLPF